MWRLVDDRPGHRRQSEGLLLALSRLARVEETVIEAGELRLRRSRPGGLTRPDLLVGAGRRTCTPMLGAALATGAATVALMDPGIPWRWLFDYAIVPRHDRLPEGPRTLVVDGVLNPLVPQKDSDPGRGLILVGGPSRHVAWSDASLLRQIREAAMRDSRVSWTLTTSRRTPEGFLEQVPELPNLRRLSWRQTPPGWLPGQLGRCGQAWASPDSVSMVYEALTAGCRVGVFDLPWKGRSRLAEGLEDLIRRRMVTPLSRLAEGEALPPAARQLAEARRSARWLLDRPALQRFRR